MSTALRATSISLVKKIQNSLDSDLSLGFKGVMVASLNTPKEMVKKSLEGVSVWLYRVIRDQETLNAPPLRLGFDTARRVPLPMRLHYLITPIVDKKDSILGPEKEIEIRAGIQVRVTGIKIAGGKWQKVNLMAFA